MCGIAGYVAFAGTDYHTLPTLAAAIAHRGPDDEGFWIEPPVALAYRRLAIIDLTPTGNQPMVSHDGRYVMVYNGEIYNYLEIRERLVGLGDVFTGNSDTEVLLAAYARWGEECLSMLNGMWAFAIWDRKAQRLFASRDRLGKKPFYFHVRGAGLIFASEVKALLATRLIPARPDVQCVANFAAERVSDHTEKTFFQGIEQLEAGHNLVWEGGRHQIRRYWTPDGSRAGGADVSPAEVRELLANAVRLRLRADTPVGLLLSGGIDSSTVTCLAAMQMQGGITAFSTMDAQEPVEEAIGIKHVLAAFPTVALHRDAPTREAFLSDLEGCLWHQEEPFADGSMVAHYRLMRIARELGVKVLLTGQGADEVFAGYPAFQAVHLADLLRRGHFSRARAFAKDIRDSGQQVPLFGALSYTLPSALRGSIRTYRLARTVDWMIPEARAVSPEVARGLAFRTGHAVSAALVDCIRIRTLPAFLHYEDRNSMAHGVETRLPFLDVNVVERLIGMRGEVSLQHGESKALLRHAMAGIVPAPILRRLRKQGYPAPLNRWLRAVGEGVWSEWLEAVGLCPLILSRPWDEHRRRFIAGDDARLPQVWRGLVIALWYRRFISRALPA